MATGSRRPSSTSPTRTRSRGSPKPSLTRVATFASHPPSAPNSRKDSKSGKSRESRDGETFALTKVPEPPKVNETAITSVLNTQPLVGPSSVPSPGHNLLHQWSLHRVTRDKPFRLTRFSKYVSLRIVACVTKSTA